MTRTSPGAKVLLAASILALVLVSGGFAHAEVKSEPVGPPRAATGCLLCHARPEIRAARGGKQGENLYVDPSTLARSVHADLDCVACHTRPSAVLHSDPAAEVARARQSCNTCHREEAEEYSSSVHARATSPLAPFNGPPPPPPPEEPRGEGGRETKPAFKPDCTTCHGFHEVPRASSREFISAAAAQCSRCHSERGETFFERNYHGKETRLGRYDVASCADCHTAHLVLPAEDPRSTVSPSRVLQTCQRCHLGASGHFGEIKIHVAGSPLPADPRLLAVTLFMTALVVSTFLFFGGHTALVITHAVRARRARRGEESRERQALFR